MAVIKNFPASTRERRMAPRATTNFKAAVYASDGGPLLHTGMVIPNLSETGLSLEGMAQLQVGRPYLIRLNTDNDRSLDCNTRIVWKADNHYIQTYGGRLTSCANKRRLQRLMREYLGISKSDSSVWKLAGIGIGLAAFTYIFLAAGFFGRLLLLAFATMGVVYLAIFKSVR